MGYTRFNNKHYAAIGVKYGSLKLVEVETTNFTIATDLARSYFDEGTDFTVAPIPEMITVVGK